MKIAQNPLSKNLAALFGDKYTPEFRKNIQFMQEDLQKKNLIAPGERNQFNADGIRFWITPSPTDPTIPFRLPSLSNLYKIAQVKEISLWDLFIDRSRYVDLSVLEKEKSEVIQMILTLKMAYIEMIQKYISSVLELQRQLK